MTENLDHYSRNSIKIGILGRLWNFQDFKKKKISFKFLFKDRFSQPSLEGTSEKLSKNKDCSEIHRSDNQW